MNIKRALGALPRLVVVGSLIGSTLVMTGCAGLIAAGVVVGAMAIGDRRTIGAQTEDTGIEVKARTELNSKLSDVGGVTITSFNRRVLLTGQVLDERTRTEAAAIVGRLDNVKQVFNELKVSQRVSMSTTTNDAGITTRVKAALVDARDVQVNTIKVVTEASVVYMMGIVTREEGNRAAQVASRVSGVQRVVTVFEYVTPDELARIERVKKEEQK